jgi:hypothetical protein
VKTNSKYYMSDLNDPTSDGKLMAPSLFVTGQRARAGMGDAQRRNLLATWLTDKSNPWFSKAFVNRMWSEMVGEGFYEPIDDIGPDRPCTAPKTLDYLASEFANNEYDVKWLFATITSTKAYQRQARVRRSLDTLPFVANSPQPLRANQIQASLAAALGISTGSPSVPARPSRSGIGAGMRGGGMMGGAGGRGRRQDDTFAYDPSTRRDEITNTITQALFMMNSRTAGGAIDVNGTTSLERLLRAISDNEALASELYLRCFSREPTPSEIKTCLTYLRESRNRKEAFEDIFWALINSAEFRQRR